MANNKGTRRYTPKSLPERQQYHQTVKARPTGDTVESEPVSSPTDQAEPINESKNQVKPAPKKKRRKPNLATKIISHVKDNLVAYLISGALLGIGTTFLFYVHLNREVGELSANVKNSDTTMKEVKDDLSKLRDMVFGLLKKK